jgi:hypothetical protein
VRLRPFTCLANGLEIRCWCWSAKLDRCSTDAFERRWCARTSTIRTTDCPLWN